MTGPSVGATATTVVGVTVPSATMVDASGCAPVVAGLTEFGTVLPGSTTATTSDCLVSFGSSNDAASLRLQQPDGAGSAMSTQTNGTWDTGFDGDGLLVLNPSTGPDTIFAMATYADGRVLVGGTWNAGAPGRSYFARRVADGSNDPTFGDGVNPVTYDFGAGDERVQDIAVGSDGSIYAVGNAAGAPSSTYVTKLRPDGSPDVSFDGDGVLRVGSAGSADNGEAISLGADGTIYVSVIGYGARTRAFIYAYGQSGAAIGWWGAAGAAAIDDGTDSWFGRNMLLDGDGRVVVAGWENVAGTTTGYIARLDRRGALDTTFAGGSGIRKLSAIPGATSIYGLAPRAGGGFALGGNGPDGPNSAGMGAWITASGALDPARGGGDGWAVITRTTPSEGADMALVAEGDDSLLLGYFLDSTGAQDAGSARLRPDGSTDATYGTGGVAALATGPGYDGPWVAQQGVDGAVYFGGSRDGTGDAFVRRTRSTSLADFSGTWAGAASAFGTCLRDVPGATATWALGTGTACNTSAPADWHGIPLTATEIARTATTATGQAALRFALHVGTSQAPGRYLAPIQFEVVAPA